MSRVEAVPLYATPRDPTRQTLGRKVGRVLAAIDGPRRDGLRGPMPWQQDTLDVACEIDPATGTFWYREVDVVVLRQAGKSSITRAKISHRAVTTPGASILYTAQDRNHALRRLQKTIYEPLAASSLADQLGPPRWSNGSEAVRFRNKAEIIIDAPGKKTVAHGESAVPEAHLDEYFAAHDTRLEQGVSPTMITVPGAQKWFLSAAGDSESVPLWAKVESGRARCQAGVHGRICYIEYSAPRDADRADPMVWAATHPAVGYTIDLEDLQSEFDSFESSGAPEEFDRAYLGWWATAKAKPWVIPREAWRQTGLAGDLADWSGEPVWSVDVAPERDWGAIGMAAAHPGVRCWTEVPAHDEGVGWLVPHLEALSRELGGRVVGVDGTGAAASLIPDLEAAGFTVLRLTRAQVVEACGGLYDDVLGETIWHAVDPDVDDALAVAKKQASGDAWRFVRTGSLSDITALYALTVARAAFVMSATHAYDPLESVG